MGMDVLTVWPQGQILLPRGLSSSEVPIALAQATLLHEGRLGHGQHGLRYSGLPELLKET